MRKKIVISGYYGFGNTGDEAVLAGILATLRQLDIDADVIVLSSDPKRTEIEHLGARSAHRYKLGAIRAIHSADLVISGGGSLLQDVTSVRSAQYYLSVLKLAQHFKRPTMIYAQGIGPLNTPSIRRSAAKILNRVKVITVRDEDSRVLLKSIGVTTPEVRVTADPSFMVEPDLAGAGAVLDELGLSGQELIGVSLRSWMGNKWLPAAIDAISAACDELGVTPVVIPMQESEDAEVGDALKCGVQMRGVRNVSVIKGIVASCGVVVGMRLHSLIFAADVGVPVVPIAYDPKVTAFARAISSEIGMDVTSLDKGHLKDSIIRAWRDREELGARIGKHAGRLRGMALESGELARQLLGTL
ncbi:MAG: polysaccharide pyruvyl transferase CsaB [Armatimonadota bacterium]|nr:polysaccharide pyruvyl transferase CsaB [bacterium]